MISGQSIVYVDKNTPLNNDYIFSLICESSYELPLNNLFRKILPKLQVLLPDLSQTQIYNKEVLENYKGMLEPVSEFSDFTFVNRPLVLGLNTYYVEYNINGEYVGIRVGPKSIQELKCLI